MYARLFRLVAVLSAVSLAAAQSVHYVDGVQHGSIESAHAVAAPNDLILVTLPTVPGFRIYGKGLIVRGVGNVRVSGPSHIALVPANETMVLENLSFMESTTPSFTTALAITSSAGPVVLRGLTIGRNSYYAFVTFNGLEVRDSSQVSVSHCTVRASSGLPGSFGCETVAGVALYATRSSISMFESAFYGGNGLLACLSAPAVEVQQSVVSAIRCQFHGGQDPAIFGGPPSYGGGIVLQASRASLSMCTGTPWLEGDSSSFCRFYGTHIGFCWTCPWPRISYIGRPLPELRVALVAGSLSVTSSSAPPQSLCFLAFSSRPAFFDFEPFGNYGALLLAFDHTSGLLAAGVNDASGSFHARFALPAALVSALGHREIFLQSLSAFSGAPWLVSNLMGFHVG